MVQLAFEAPCVAKEEEDRTSIAPYTCKNLPPSNQRIYTIQLTAFLILPRLDFVGECIIDAIPAPPTGVVAKGGAPLPYPIA